MFTKASNTLCLQSIEPAGDVQGTRRVHLTPRQREVLALLCEGLPNKLICRRLNISAGTVKVHIGSILREAGVSSRLQAVVWARQCGLELCNSLSEEMPGRIHEIHEVTHIARARSGRLMNTY